MSLLIAKEFGLNRDQQTFADQYILTGDAQTAYMIAYGCTRRCANGNAYKQLKHPKIQAYIKQRMLEKDENIAKEDELLMYLTSILRDPNTNTSDRLKCIDMLGKRYGYNQPKQKEETLVIDFMGGNEYEY